jgi:hypothetical protein
MPFHLIIVCALMGFVVAWLFAVYLRLTRKRRAIAGCERTYRRLRRRRRRPASTVAQQFT